MKITSYHGLIENVDIQSCEEEIHSLLTDLVSGLKGKLYDQDRNSMCSYTPRQSVILLSNNYLSDLIMIKCSCVWLSPGPYLKTFGNWC